MLADARAIDPNGEGRSGSSHDLRAAVLRAGGVLGWRTDEVTAFAEALTGRAWPRCTEADLRLVLDEYRDLATLAAAKLARRAARLGGRRHHATPR